MLLQPGQQPEALHQVDAGKLIFSAGIPLKFIVSVTFHLIILNFNTISQFN